MSNTRSKLLGLNAKMTRTRIVEVKDPDGEPIKVQVRSPSIAQSAMFAAAGQSQDSQAQTRVMAQIIVQCCHDPDSGERLFTEADMDLILECPADGWVPPLVTAVTDLLSQAQDQAKN